MKLNWRKLFALLVVFALLGGCCYVMAYPEKVSTIAKKQLYNDIQSGDQEAIDYYNSVYTSKGVYLFGDEPKSDIINLATVIDFEATESGVLLHTADGNGYYIEKQ